MISEDWDDWVEEGPTCPGLFDPDTIYDDAEQCWEDAKGRGFDIVKIRKDWRVYSALHLSFFLLPFSLSPLASSFLLCSVPLLLVQFSSYLKMFVLENMLNILQKG